MEQDHFTSLINRLGKKIIAGWLHSEALPASQKRMALTSRDFDVSFSESELRRSVALHVLGILIQGSFLGQAANARSIRTTHLVGEIVLQDGEEQKIG
jgi:hypothetical protein